MIVLSLVDRFAWKVQATNWSFYLHIGHFSMWKSCWVATSLDTLWRYQSPTVWTQHRLLRRDATRTRIRKQEKNRCSWYFVCLLAHFFKTSKHLLTYENIIYIYIHVCVKHSWNIWISTHHYTLVFPGWAFTTGSPTGNEHYSFSKPPNSISLQRGKNGQFISLEFRKSWFDVIV